MRICHSNHRKALYALTIVATLLLGATAEAQVRGTVLRKRIDQRGDLVFAGNSVHTCSATGSLAARCTNAQKGINDKNGDGPNEINNTFNMTYINAGACGTAGHPACPHGTSTTFNSSGANLDIPATGTVSWAGLYWFCTTGRPTNQSNPPNVDDRNQVLFAPPGSAYGNVTADMSNAGTDPAATSFFEQGLPDPAPGQGATYLAYVDVTTAVQAAGAGTYWLANMQCGHDATNLFSGWTLAVIYADSDPTAPLRTISVYDSYDQETPGTNGSTPAHDIVLHPSGFASPHIGPVQSHIGVVSGDGDAAYEDTLVVVSPDPANNPNNITPTTTSIGDSISPPNNVANSTISALGQQVTDRFPDYVNTLGFDQDLFDTSGALPLGATSAQITAHSDTENIFIGILSFASVVEEPVLVVTETVTDLNGLIDGKALPGDELVYTITLTNTGNDGAANTQVSDLIPPNTVYVPDTIIVSGANATDATDGDTGELGVCMNAQNVPAPCISARPGVGATGTVGGTIAAGTTTTVTFHVKVADPVATGTAISTQSTISYEGITLIGGAPLFSTVSDGDPTTPGNQVTTVTVGSAPDVTATKTANPLVNDINHDGHLNPGEELDYTITVKNSGTDTAHAVVVTDAIDGNTTLIATPTVVPPDQSISVANGTVTVTLGDLPAGAQAVITIKTTVNQPFPTAAGGQVSNQAVVSGGNFTTVPTDDPGVPGNANPTVTTVTTTNCECFILGACYAIGAVSGQGCLVCDPTRSTITWSINAGASCDDGKSCTDGTTCDILGICSGGTSNCEVGLPECVEAACGLDGACTPPVIDGSHCLVDGMCVAAGTTEAGSDGCMICVGGTLGYSPVLDGTNCDDGKFCTVDNTSSCLAGKCIGGTPNCNDGLGCTVDTCDEAGGQCHNTLPPGPNGTAPLDCVIDGACYPAGATDPGMPCKVCNPGANPFEWSNIANGTTCGSGGRCDTNQCEAGACVETSTTCDDGIACSVDSCDAITGQCEFTAPAGHCFVDGTCPANGAVDPADACKVCDATHPTVWTQAPSGTACDDGLACTKNDTCNAQGVCAGTSNCPDLGLVCAVNTCTTNGCRVRAGRRILPHPVDVLPGRRAQPAERLSGLRPRGLAVRLDRRPGPGLRGCRPDARRAQV